MPSFFPPIIFGPSGRGAKQNPGVGGWNVAIATADVSILNNNTTPVVDTDMRFNAIAGETYAFHALAFFSANGAQDVRFTVGGTVTLTRLVAGYRRTDNTNVMQIGTPTIWTPAPFTSFPVSVINNTSLGEWSGPIEVHGSVTPATSGVFGFAWCQGTAASAVNPTTRLAGSWLNWRKV